MLRLTQRGEVAELGELTADEDVALRRAFGRYGRIEDRVIGAAVVRRLQHQEPADGSCATAWATSPGRLP